MVDVAAGTAPRRVPLPQLVAKRPVSPHVFEISGLQPHYKFPLGAISSITNRATGCMLSVGEAPRLSAARLPWARSCVRVVAVHAVTHHVPMLQAACCPWS